MIQEGVLRADLRVCSKAMRCAESDSGREITLGVVELTTELVA